MRAAPLLEHVEHGLSALAQKPTRIDLRLYKSQRQAVLDLIRGDVDFMQMNAREYVRAKMQDPDVQPLVRVVRSHGQPRCAENPQSSSRAKGQVSKLSPIFVGNPFSSVRRIRRSLFGQRLAWWKQASAPGIWTSIATSMTSRNSPSTAPSFLPLPQWGRGWPEVG